MLYKKVTIEQVKVAYVVIMIRLNAEDFEGLPKMTQNGNLTLKINVETGQIVDWPETEEEWSVFDKITDTGTYQLLDINNNLLAEKKECYVPSELIPPTDGFGDYISLKINKLGVITNWYENPSSIEFDEEYTSYDSFD